MNIALVTRPPAGSSGGPRRTHGAPLAVCSTPTAMPVAPTRRRLGLLTVGLAALLMPLGAQAAGPAANEPPNGCLLAAINERAVMRAKNYLHPDVEAHLLAIMFQHSKHVALIVKGDHHWFAWDDTYGGRPLFYSDVRHLPDPVEAAHAAFPRTNVELAWWADEADPTHRAAHKPRVTETRGMSGVSVADDDQAAAEPEHAAHGRKHGAGRSRVAAHQRAGSKDHHRRPTGAKAASKHERKRHRR